MKEIILDESILDIDKWLPQEAIDQTVELIRNLETHQEKAYELSELSLDDLLHELEKRGSDFAEYEYTKLRSVFQKGNKCYYYVDLTVYNDNPNVLSDKTFPELFEAMQNYEIIKVDHNGLWSDFIYLGTMDNV